MARLQKEVIDIPSVKPGESQKEFVSRCIPYLIHEGKHPNTPKGRKAAAGECYGIWRSSKKSDDEIAKCVKCGLKDANGYFCRYKTGEKFYYEINDTESKQLARNKAEEFGLNKLLEEIPEEETKQEKIPKPSGSTDNVPQEEVYSVPKSKDEIGTGTIISYKGKIGKVVKVINI